TEEPSWLNALYRAGIHGAFDVLALHLYGPTPTWAINRIKSARQVMDRHGDRRKSIWVTEFSWAGGPPDPYLPSPRAQRVQVSQFMSLVGGDKSRLGLGELFWWGWQDKVYGPDPSWWGYHLGMFTQKLVEKPALNVLSAWGRKLDR
ncbi:MAG TPA: glycosyl hydrolase, partial [Solirubrobacteraceae bacterium]|nr:glycosyl hydrolase [Solirubrobacteraceae bacterium]